LVTTSAVSTGTAQHPDFHRRHHAKGAVAPLNIQQRADAMDEPATWSGTAMHAGIVPGYPASHGCIRLTYSFAPKFFQMSSIGDNVITSRGRPKPTPIEHGALFQPLPPPTLPMVEKEASVSPLERIGTPIPAVAAAAATPVILAKAEMPTTVIARRIPGEEMSTLEPAASSNEGPGEDANAEAAGAMTSTEDNTAETESDPYRVHAITPDISKRQSARRPPSSSPPPASPKSLPTSLSPLLRPHQSQSLRRNPNPLR
jgi:hypothetical protein